MKNRITALALLLSLVFCLGSCGRQPNDSERDIILIPVAPEGEYGDPAIAMATERIMGLIGSLMPLLGYQAPSGSVELEIRSFVEGAMIPYLKEVPIYEAELSAVLSLFEEYVDALYENADNNKENSLKIISDLYIKAVSVVDQDRVGSFFYGLSLSLVQHRKNVSLERYEKYGYQFYLDDYEYYVSLEGRVDSLGEAGFESASGILMFFISSLFGGFGGGALALNANEICAVLNRQGRYFLENNLGDEEWETLISVLCELIPKQSQSLFGAMTYTLGDEGGFQCLAPVISLAVSTYAGIAASLVPEDIPTSEDGVKVLIARKLTEDKESFISGISVIKNSLPKLSAAQISAVNSYDRAGYAAYLEELQHIGAEEVYLAVSAISASTDEETLAAAQSAMLNYLAECNSAIIYVYFCY